ncbi:MAG: carboxymuconolactone decarboxylase family protein [Bacteroidetes bacterium]|nr:carboxymuconolactone decarboxylase [Saprospirales bacterium]RME02023.1 MAG: carboxymuconolactone decarboxylase family protein [Bacteroidota bacterium]
MKDKPPKRFQQFTKDYPEIAKAYFEIGEAVHKAGPLDDKTRALVKIAISGASRQEGGFHAHVRKARRQGISKEEIQHVALLTLPTLGFPSMMMLLSWIDDVFDKD